MKYKLILVYMKINSIFQFYLLKLGKNNKSTNRVGGYL